MTWHLLPLLLAPYLAQVAPGWADIEWGRPTITELRVHAQAPPWLKRAAVRAARDWCRMDRSLCLKVRLVRWGENVMVRPEIAEYGFAGLTSWWAEDEPPVIMIADRKQMPYMTPEEVLSHELGHALCGCIGHLENYGLMDGREELAAEEPIESDVEMVLFFRRLSHPKARASQ